MRRATLILLAAAMLLNACGVTRPLIRPQDIPAHEAKKQKAAEQYHTDGKPADDDDADDKDW